MITDGHIEINDCITIINYGEEQMNIDKYIVILNLIMI